MSWHVVHILKEKHIAKGEQEKDKQIMKSLLEKHDNFALNNDIERLKAHMTIKHKSMRRIDATIDDLKNWLIRACINL